MSSKNNKSDIFHFENNYYKLGSKFFERIDPLSVKKPKLIRINQKLTQELEIHNCDSDELLKILSGNKVVKTSKPIAQAYSGHQFGNFSPKLGDGRAIMLGEIKDKKGNLFDLTLKGSGATSFSRNGDGRYALGPAIREFVVSEAMHNLKIKTARSLALVTTGELVFRDQPFPGAVVSRVSASHIRVGTFEYFAALGDKKAIKSLADFTISRHYAKLEKVEDKYLKLLREVIKANVNLIVDWMRIGFIHGVMNTDNTLICGHTIDYGPCAFMDNYNPGTVFSSIDRYSRYAFANQPNIILWNLTCFANTILPLIDDEVKVGIKKCEKELDKFSDIFNKKYMKVMCNKIGLFEVRKSDQDLVQNLLDIMHENNLDYTNTFRNLDFDSKDDDILKDWKKDWLKRIENENNGKTLKQREDLMKKNNPFIIPRNHQIQKAIDLAVAENDYSLVDELSEAFKYPYKEDSKYQQFTVPPNMAEVVKETFCGT